ncbi:type III secretion system stator protein SctL [Pseudomonas sp. P7548]|nr:type III secretion system stator protein SctL [Pseudomonas sp. P7548]
MLCRHSLELPSGASGLPRNLILREELKDWDQANQILRHASAQADELISQAERKCEVLQQEASLQVWQRADTQLKQWDLDRQAMCDSLEHYATRITQQAMRRLLDDIAPPQRLAALLKQLLASQVQEVNATLLCHPHDVEEIEQCLSLRNATYWKLHTDEAIRPQTLVLQTDEGDFRISWNSLLEAFFNSSQEYLDYDLKVREPAFS